MNNEFFDCELILKVFSLIFVECVGILIKFIMKILRGKYKIRKKLWFLQLCFDFRNIVKNYEKFVNKYLFNGEYRKMFYIYKVKYRRLCKFEE